MSKLLALALGALVLLPTSLARAQAPASPEAQEPPAVPSEFARAQRQGRWLSTFGIHASLGLAFGGEELAQLEYADGSTSSVRAGEGVSLMAGLTWTPLWLGERVGLGLGFDGGWKFKSTSVDSDGSAKLERFPLVLSLRNLVGLGKSWHTLLAVGGVTEVGSSLYGDGVLSALDYEFDVGLGGMAELGILWGRPGKAGWEITGRYTLLSYDEDIDASSGSINLTVHYFL